MTSLKYFKTHPLRIPKSNAMLKVGQVRATEKASVHPQSIHPTAGAYIHYGGVELADTLTILAPSLSEGALAELAELWYASCGVICKQLLFYTWQICTKEMRHGSTDKCAKAFSSWDKAHDPKYATAMQLCSDVSSGGSYSQKLDSALGAVTLAGPYMEAVERQFRKGGWSGAYGGPKWADITLEMVRYFNGDASAMIAADRLWSAVHNTGPIFNKGFYFHYHDSNLLKVLNAQAGSSVFQLEPPSDFLTKDGYDHPTSDAFCKFAVLALKAIQSVKPDYMLGDTGGINSDGTKASDNPPTGKVGKKGKSKDQITFGPFAYKGGQRQEQTNG